MNASSVGSPCGVACEEITAVDQRLPDPQLDQGRPSCRRPSVRTGDSFIPKMSAALGIALLRSAAAMEPLASAGEQELIAPLHLVNGLLAEA